MDARGKFFAFIKGIRRDPEFQSVRGIFLFIFITLLIHISYRFWTHSLDYFPIRGLFSQAILFMEDLVFRQSHWIIAHVLQISVVRQDYTLWLSYHWGIVISEGCTGLKQIIQVLLLFLIYPGPWKQKAWFIPAGIILIHLTNLMRIVLLAIAMNFNLPAIHFIHNYPLRLFFYVVIFVMWWIWAEKIAPGGRKKTNQKPI